MHTNDDLLMISGLQHLAFCERQCAFIHVEQQWEENRLTVLGKHMHERVHNVENESRGSIRCVRGLRLVSHKLGLVGQADMVEYHSVPDRENAVEVPGIKGWWRPFPVEYKRGKPKRDNCDKVQLCAQAICLEEMTEVDILQGALYYGKKRRRQDVKFDGALRQETIDASKRLHDLIESGITPMPVYTPKCESCSFFKICLPKTIEKGRSVNNYLSNMI